MKDSLASAWCIKPSFIDGMSITCPKGYFTDNAISDGLCYYSPKIFFRYHLNRIGYDINLPLLHNPSYYSHPAYEYTKFIIDTIINLNGAHKYELQCELHLMSDIPKESWIMNSECTVFNYLPIEYDLDATGLYCDVTVIFHNVIGTKILLSNLFDSKFYRIQGNKELYKRYNDERSKDIFGRTCSGFDCVSIDYEYIELNEQVLKGASLEDLCMYIPWMIPDEMDNILSMEYNGPIVTLIGYVNRNISQFVQYNVTINDIPSMEGITAKQVKLIMNKLFVHKRTRRMFDKCDKRKNIELYSYNPSQLSPNLYAIINENYNIDRIARCCSTVKGIKHLNLK